MKIGWLVVVFGWLGVVGCGDSTSAPAAPDAAPDAAPGNPARASYRRWETIEIPGTKCGNDSQYKVFANYSDTSDNLVVVMEPGGACWDFDSCTGANGIRGAANVDGIPDGHESLAPIISPFLNRGADDSPSRDWNMIYLPYCTGDVFTGNRVVTYHDDTGAKPDVVFHHDGHADMTAVASWLDANFTHVPKLLVTGCSAGGAGALVNYHFLRKGLHGVDKGYLLDDSGPIFPSDSFSGPMHEKIREAWDLGSISDSLPAGFVLSDMGTVNTALADEFPNDRLATTYFLRDYNFSLYSYERFYNFPSKDEIHSMWAADTDKLTALYATRKNLYYFLPYFRTVNNSHCTTLFNFIDSDIEDHQMTLRQWVNDFVDDKPIQSMQEAPVAGEDL
ncbi:MAG: pectin acetylesterase-family hydrolase [Kofleriaceae bacterium]